jgi:hypothetical protein
MTEIHDVNARLVQSVGELAIRRDQYIPDSFLDDLRERREANERFNFDGFSHVASVPVYLVEDWQRNGYDVYTSPVAETMRRLRQHELEQYLATRKTI